MSDERTAPEKATITLVYHLVDELRKEVNTRFGGLDDRFDSLLAAIEALRCDFVSRGEWEIQERADKQALADAVKSSSDDREKLWDSVHGIESQLKWAAGIIIVAFLGLFIYLMQAHL